MKTEEIALYLPHKLRCIAQGEENVFDFVGISYFTRIELQEIGRTISDQHDIEDVLPILRPMAEAESYFEKLYGSLEHQDVTDYMDPDFLEEHDLEINELKDQKAEAIPYGTLKVLIKHHFDVFRLIIDGLAVSHSEYKRNA